MVNKKSSLIIDAGHGNDQKSVTVEISNDAEFQSLVAQGFLLLRGGR